MIRTGSEIGKASDEKGVIGVMSQRMGFSGVAVAQALTLHDRNLDAANTEDEPERIKPAPLEDVAVAGDRLHATLPPGS